MAADFPQLAALKRGEQGAWSEAFRQLWPLAWHAARNPAAHLTLEDAEEAALDALIQLVEQIGQMQTPDQVKALVCMIAHRRAISLARRKSAVKRGPIPVSLDAAMDSSEPLQVASESNSPAIELELREQVILLHRALGSLDAETRTLLYEKIGCGWSYQELSKRHSLPIGTACAKVARGLKRLRQALGQTPQLLNELRSFLR